MLVHNGYNRRISDELYDDLRNNTPTQAIRDNVNEGVSLPMNDPALHGLEITKKLHADHIVSMDKITSMDGFEELTRQQQLDILNYEKNFAGLSEAANCSKGNKSFEDWTRHKSKGIDVDPQFREEMMRKEKELAAEIQNKINEILKGK